MLRTRKTLIDFLEEKFLNPEIKNACVKEFHELLSDVVNKSGRLFYSIKDSALCSDAELQVFHREFMFHLQTIKSENIQTTENRILLKSKHDKELINIFFTSLIKFACDELLDSDGHLKVRLKELFNFKQEVTQEQVFRIVIAYVHHLYQFIFLYGLDASKEQAAEIFSHPNQYHACSQVLQTEHHILIAEHLRANKQFFDKEALDRIQPLPYEIQLLQFMQKTSTLAVAGAALLAVGLFAVSVFVQSRNSGPRLPRPGGG